MENGVSGVLIGVGPGAACTSRGVLGLGVPQVTATVDCAAARDAYFKKNRTLRPDHHRRRHVQGRRRLQGAGLRLRRRHGRLRLRPRRGSAGPGPSLGHGHAAREPAARHAHPCRRHRHAQADSLRPGHGRRRLAKPGRRDHDLHGQRRRVDHPEFQETEIIIAPSIKSEGKLFQTVQGVGMGSKRPTPPASSSRAGRIPSTARARRAPTRSCSPPACRCSASATACSCSWRCTAARS
jgi:IMP dehydrogenase